MNLQVGKLYRLYNFGWFCSKDDKSFFLPYDSIILVLEKTSKLTTKALYEGGIIEIEVFSFRDLNLILKEINLLDQNEQNG